MGTLDRYDDVFISKMLEIEQHYTEFSKHDRIRIEKWSKKL